MAREITISGMEFDTVYEAIQHADASGYGDQVLTVGGRYFLVTDAEAERLDRAGVVSAKWFDHDGILMSVPA